MNDAGVLDLGRMGYRDALTIQRRVHAQVASGDRGATWIVVEHEPVVTLGRNAKGEHLLLSRERLAALGVDVVAVERGGDVTYHGPGQLVVYPIMKLERFREIVPLVTALETAVIAALATFDIAAHGNSVHRGVYVGRDAICAIGLSVKQMTTLHGLALNVSNSLEYDRLITPCGTPEFGITSMSRALGYQIQRNVASAALFEALSATFNVEFKRESQAIA